MLSALAIGTIVLLSSGCQTVPPPPLMYTLTVVNRCAGPDYSVDVYTNGTYRGIVTFEFDFLVFYGALDLRAVGTGLGGSVFRDSTFVNSDLVWTLCPLTSSATSSLDASAALELEQ